MKMKMKMKMNTTGTSAPSNGVAHVATKSAMPCKQCGALFHLSAAEVEYFLGRKLNLPRRCTSCRQASRHNRARVSTAHAQVTQGDAEKIAAAVVSRLVALWSAAPTTPTQATAAPTREVRRRTREERDAGVASLCAVLTERPHGLARKILQAALQLSDADCESILRDAIRRGKVFVTGRGRGTRYVLAPVATPTSV